MSDRVLIDIQDHVANVQMNRPDRHNALDGEQFAAVYEAGRELSARKDVRAVVLSGNGPSFCSGLDFPAFQQPGQSIMSAFANPDNQVANIAQRVAYIWKEMPMPVIAAIHGVAYGGGCQLALGADIRIAAPTSKMSVMEIEYGLIPDMAITQTLPPLVGLDVAKELTYTGRVVKAEEAKQLGLVTQLSETPQEAALELAQQIAGRSPTAIRATKKLFDKAWPVDTAWLKDEAVMQQGIIAHPNFAEAVAAKMQKRAASFSDDF